MKKLIGILAASAAAVTLSLGALAGDLLIAPNPNAAAADPDANRVITVNLNGTPIEFDVTPRLINDRTMVPVRAIFEALGAEVGWNDETQTVIANKGENEIKLTIGEKLLYKNGKATFIDTPAMLVKLDETGDRTLVPLRAISESFDVKVGWDDATSTVSLSEKASIEFNKDSFVPGNGFNIVKKNGETRETTAKNSPVTVADAEGGVKVSHGGYYEDGKNWGGVATKDAYTLDGLSVTIRFDKIPTVSSGDDCWISVDFLAKPQLFQVGDIAGNPGFMNLMRFGSKKLEVYDGITAFKGLAATGYDENMFGIKSGDTVTVSAKLDGDYYTFTFVNGAKSYEWTHESEELADCFKDGKAHIAIAASLLGSDKDAFEYTITDISGFAD